MDDPNAMPPPPPVMGGPPPMGSPPPAGPGLGLGKLPPTDEKNMGMLAHLLGALFSFVGPLIIWLMKREESPFVNDQGREALNFQITAAIAMLACGVLMFITALIAGPLACIFQLAMLAVWVADLAYSIIAAIASSKGEAYRYPFSVRLIN